MMEKTSILVVEDEVIPGMDMISRLKKMGYEVFPLAKNPDEAMKRLEDHQPDILMMDIHLGDKHIDGIELANQIKKKYHLPFIFLTSHSEGDYIDRAKAVGPSSYLLKPFRDKEISIAIEMALANFSGQEKGTVAINDSLFLKKDDRFARVKFEHILWLKADSNYTEIHTTEETFIYSTVLKKVESVLPKESFYRVHRSYIVNKESITGFSGNTLLISDQKIPVSRQYRDMVFRWFNMI
ncbi:MAG: response regulator [bacterium]|nr:response regulator [bacterium]